MHRLRSPLSVLTPCYGPLPLTDMLSENTFPGMQISAYNDSYKPNDDPCRGALSVPRIQGKKRISSLSRSRSSRGPPVGRRAASTRQDDSASKHLKDQNYQ